MFGSRPHSTRLAVEWEEMGRFRTQEQHSHGNKSKYNSSGLGALFISVYMFIRQNTTNQIDCISPSIVAYPRYATGVLKIGQLILTD